MESMLMASKKAKSIYAIDIDTANLPLGSSALVDNAGNQWALVKGSTSPRIVSDATMGNVMEFSYNGYFGAPIPASLDLAGRSWTLEAVFRAATVSNVMTVFSTGDYNANGRVLGILLYLNQFASQYIQAFVDNGTYVRLYPIISNNSSWERVVITRVKGSSLKMDVYRNNVLAATVTIPDNAPGPGGPYMNIGGSVIGGTNQLGGWFKSLRVLMQ